MDEGGQGYYSPFPLQTALSGSEDPLILTAEDLCLEPALLLKFY